HIPASTAASNDRRPEASVAEAREVDRVRRGDDHAIAGLTDRRRTGCEDDVGIECVGMGCRNTLAAGIGPKQRSLAPLYGRYRVADHSPHRDQGIEPIHRGGRADASQLTTNLVVGDLGHCDYDAAGQQTVEPLVTLESRGLSWTAACRAERARVEENVFGHRSI